MLCFCSASITFGSKFIRRFLIKFYRKLCQQSFQHTNQIYIYIFCWAVGMFMQRFWCVGADRWPKLKVLITLVRYISRCMCFSILIITKPLFVCVCVVYMQNRLFVLQSRIDIAGHVLAGTPFLFDLNLAPVKFYSW